MKKGLKLKFIKSHGSIAIYGAILLLISLLAIFWLKNNTMTLLNQSVPIAQTSEDIQTQLQTSLAALRGWMNLADQQFIKERNDAWKKGINPDLKKIEKLANDAHDIKLQKQIKTLKSKLQELEMWQWQIEDVAQAPGDNNTKIFFERKINLSAKHIISLVSTIINKKRKNSLSKNSKIIYDLADFRGFFLKSQALMTNYILTNNKINLKNAKKSLAIAKNRIQQIRNNKNLNSLLTAEQNSILKNLSAYFDQYPSLINQLITKKERKYQHISVKLLAEKAVPLSRSSIKILDNIVESQKIKVYSEINKSELITKSIIYGMILFIFLMVSFTLWIANRNAKRFLHPISLLLDATKKVAAGQNNKKITLENDDELSELTASFNQMLYQRELSEEKMKQLIETAIDPILTINKKGIIQSINTATITLTGYTEKELVGSNISMIMPEPYRSHHDNYLEKYLRTRSKNIIGSSREVATLTKDGEQIPVSLSISEINVGDEQLFAGILHDIRKEKKQAEEMKLLNTQLESENKEQALIGKIDSLLRST